MPPRQAARHVFGSLSPLLRVLRRGLRPVDPALVDRLVQAAADDPVVGSVNLVSVGGSLHGPRILMTLGLPGAMPLADALEHREQARARVQRFIGPRGIVQLRLEALPDGMGHPDHAPTT